MWPITIVIKKYASFRKKAWSWLTTLVGRKKTAARGARPDKFPQISAGGFPVWSCVEAAADGMQHKATTRTKRAAEAQRCTFRPDSGSNSAHSRKHNDIYTPPGRMRLQYVVVSRGFEDREPGAAEWRGQVQHRGRTAKTVRRGSKRAAPEAGRRREQDER